MCRSLKIFLNVNKENDHTLMLLQSLGLNKLLFCAKLAALTISIGMFVGAVTLKRKVFWHFIQQTGAEKKNK